MYYVIVKGYLNYLQWLHYVATPGLYIYYLLLFIAVYLLLICKMYAPCIMK